MAYNINLSNGTALISGGLADGTIDTTNTSLTLVGKNYPGYGLFLNQNFVQLAENFAKSSAPTAPLPGQIWYNTTVKKLYLNTAATKNATPIWKNLSLITYDSSYTQTAVTGEFWYDTSVGQLKIWTGASWTIIGPAASSVTGNSGAIPDTIAALSPSATYVVLKFYIDNTLVGIWSKESSFTTAVTGFATVNPGLNLSTALNQSFYGNAYVANNLYISGIAIPGSSFLRNDTSGTINGSLSLTNDTGLSFGVAGDFKGSVTSGNVTLSNQTNNKDLILNIKIGGSPTNMLKANASSGYMEAYATPISTSPALSLATKGYVDSILGGGIGTTSFAANLVPSANLTYNIGSTSLWWDTIYGVSIQAKYADLAERFKSDRPYNPGTVVELGGAEEITAVVEELSDEVFGVISTRAAYLMNGAAGDNSTHPPVAVSGRVPVNVIGKVRKGDRLVSAGNGLARAGSKNEISPFNVIGRSLEDKLDSGEGIVEAIVTLNS